MPGSVTSFKAGRTYPMEGTAVLLPQHAPYTDPLEILVCGGSDFGDVLDNCVTIAPEAPNPTWVLERMVCHIINFLQSLFLIIFRTVQPSKRVMPCMAGS